MKVKYKQLYNRQVEEHEQTWARLRRAQKDIELSRMSYEGAMVDNEELVAVMRKHCIAMLQFLDLNYPRKDQTSKGLEQ